MRPRKTPRKTIKPELIHKDHPAAKGLPEWRDGIVNRWYFEHKGVSYFMEHNPGSIRVYSVGTTWGRVGPPKATFTYITFGTPCTLPDENIHARWSFGSGGTREIENKELLNTGIGTHMLKAAENECLLAHGRTKAKEPLVLAGSTRRLSTLRLFLANGYKLTRSAWGVLEKSGVLSRLGIKVKFEEGNEAELLNALKKRDLSKPITIREEDGVIFYKEIKEPNKL